eukprot:6634465-Prymnesium_polylepis.1
MVAPVDARAATKAGPGFAQGSPSPLGTSVTSATPHIIPLWAESTPRRRSMSCCLRLYVCGAASRRAPGSRRVGSDARDVRDGSSTRRYR